MRKSRTQNTKRNIVFSMIDTCVTLLFQFISRTIIVKVLGEQYLGLSSLFTSILHVLNMAELGFSSAIIYNMYKPIADDDIGKVCTLLNYYRKIYRIISLIIIVLGLLLTPFLPHLIKGEYPKESNIYLLFILYVINTACSYSFFAYKTALLNALQRLDLSKIAYTIANVLQYLFQIMSLVIFRSYYLFIIGMICGTIGKNLLAAYLSDKYYPQYKCSGEISQALKNDVLSRVKGLLICNISGVTYTTFDSIILSAFIGLASVAIYNNYILVFNGISLFIRLIRNAMQSSVGNSVALETTEKNYEDMLLWQFLFSIIATWCVTCMVVLYQPFMKLWMGQQMLLPIFDVVLICAWFFISETQHAFFLYLSGNGLWWEMRWPYIFSTVTNLVLNIVLGKAFGITGIIFATFFSSFIFGLIWQCYIVFKYYFRRSMKTYQFRQLTYSFVCVLCCFIAYLMSKYVPIEGVLGILVRIVICSIVSLGLQLFIYRKSKEFTRTKRLIGRIVGSV